MTEHYPPGYPNQFTGRTLFELRTIWFDNYGDDTKAEISSDLWPTDPDTYGPADILHSITVTCGRCTTPDGKLSKAPLARIDRLRSQWAVKGDFPTTITNYIYCRICSLSLSLSSIQVQAHLESLLHRKQVPNRTDLKYMVEKVKSQPLNENELARWLHPYSDY